MAVAAAYPDIAAQLAALRAQHLRAAAAADTDPAAAGLRNRIQISRCAADAERGGGRGGRFAQRYSPAAFDRLVKASFDRLLLTASFDRLLLTGWSKLLLTGWSKLLLTGSFDRLVKAAFVERPTGWSKLLLTGWSTLQLTTGQSRF